MHLNELKYFTEVAQCQSISRAAERLGLTQPSLSLSMKRLEAQVGTLLFNRYKTGVKLTVAGKRFLAKTHHLIQLWEETKFSAYQAENLIEGQFTIGCHPSVAMYHIPSQFSKLLIDNPNLNIKVTHGLSREVNEAVISMKIDLGIVVNPVKHPSLVIIKLRQDKVGFWHHADFSVKKNTMTLLADPNLTQAATLIRLSEKKGIVFNRTIECQSLELLARLACQKVGVAVLPKTVALAQGKGVLKPFRPSQVYHDEICLVFRHEVRFIKAIEAILETFKSASKR